MIKLVKNSGVLFYSRHTPDKNSDKYHPDRSQRISEHFHEDLMTFVPSTKSFDEYDRAQDFF